MRTDKYLARAGLVAALYTVLTIALAPISFNLIQCRVSEALCLLPAVMAPSVPGLFIGCLIANLISGAPIYDVIIGSIATLVGCVLTRFMAKKNCSVWLLPIPTVLSNAVLVGCVLYFVYQVPVVLPVATLAVAAGEIVSCYALGVPMLLFLKRKQWNFLDESVKNSGEAGEKYGEA